MMKTEHYLVGLDIGTTKTCTLVARHSETGLELISSTVTPSAGLRKSLVVDMDAAVSAIKDCIHKAKEASGVEIKEVCVGISGGHIGSFKSSGAVGIADGVVKKKDIDKVLETAQTVYVSLDKEVLHIIPVEYIVDGESEILNPIGMRGVRLEANVQIVTGSVNAVQNLLKCCEMAGLGVVEVVLDPLVSSLAVLKPDEKEYGVILIDIGGGTTKVALFKNNTFMGTAILDIGGNQITNDLAVGLRLPVVEAESLKKAYGMTTLAEGGDKEEVTVIATNGEERKISKFFITEIIKPRCEELLSMVKTEVERLQGYEQAPCGVVLTGGISLMIGLDRMVESTLKMPVRIGLPESDFLIEKVKGPAFSTAVGLIMHAAKDMSGGAVMDRITGEIGSVKKWLMGFIGKLFRVH